MPNDSSKNGKRPGPRPEQPRILEVWLQTERGVIPLLVVMDFHRRALRRKRPLEKVWTSWRALRRGEVRRLLERPA